MAGGLQGEGFEAFWELHSHSNRLWWGEALHLAVKRARQLHMKRGDVQLDLKSFVPRFQPSPDLSMNISIGDPLHDQRERSVFVGFNLKLHFSQLCTLEMSLASSSQLPPRRRGDRRLTEP